MITESRFTTGVIKCEPRRRWGRKVLFLVAALLVCWLLSGCEVHGEAPPWLKGAVLGLCTFGMIVVLWRVALWIKRRDDEALDRWGSVSEPAKAGTTILEEDPLALPYIGMKQEDLLRILASMIVECCMAEELVRKAAAAAPDKRERLIYCPNCGVLAGINPVAVPVRLREAMNCLHGLKVCLGKLADCAAKGSEKPATAEVAP